MGARRVCQKNIDEAVPRKSFKPELEALTTFVGFGNSWGQSWDAQKILKGLQRKERERWKAAELYDKAELLVVDEAAQARAPHTHTHARARTRTRAARTRAHAANVRGTHGSARTRTRALVA